jgi:tRNA(Ile)-lysidine synthase TilS/MesJ
LTVEYAVRCDGCGRLIATSRSSARAARADAQLNRGAHSREGQDWCGRCRKKRVDALNRAAQERGVTLGHSINGGLPPKFGPSS